MEPLARAAAGAVRDAAPYSETASREGAAAAPPVFYHHPGGLVRFGGAMCAAVVSGGAEVERVSVPQLVLSGQAAGTAVCPYGSGRRGTGHYLGHRNYSGFDMAVEKCPPPSCGPTEMMIESSR